MKRFLIVAGFLALGVGLTVFSFVARTTRTSREGMVRQRGQVPSQLPSQTLNRGRIGTQAAVPFGAQTWTGLLMDAGCLNRDVIMPGVATTAATMPGGGTETPPGGGGAAGVTVSGQTLERERADAMAHLVPDLRSRMSDPACSVTGNTRALALYLSNDELKNLDQGGNTLAMEAFEGRPEGQAVMSGRSPGWKPPATVTGVEQGDKIIVSRVRLM